MTIPVCSAWDRLPHVAEDDPWAAGCPVSILNEASGLGWTERKTYFKWKIERWWCCSLGWDIGYPRPMDWRGICFFIQRGGKVTWNFDDLVGIRTSLVAQMVYCLSTMRETWVWFLSWEDSLEKEMATHSSPLALRIPWTEELGAGYCPWGCKESGTTERLHFHFLGGDCSVLSCLQKGVHVQDTKLLSAAEYMKF